MKMNSGFIDGKYVEGTGVNIAIVNPSNISDTYDYKSCNQAQLDQAITSSQREAIAWAAATPSYRSRILLRWADLIEADADRLTELEVRETGKPVPVFKDGELPFAADNLRYFAGAARSLEGTGAGVLSTGYTSMLIRRPIGVIGSIAPWNFPLVMAIWKFGPALAVGNGVVLKPAPQTPSSSMRLAELGIEAGLPSGLFNVVSGDDELGKALVNHQGIAMVSVTGATSTGRNIMRSAADTTKRVHLELGGKAPVLVFEDADLAAMAQSITLGATYNTGQDCTAATRVYVQKSKFDEACAQLTQVMKSVKFGTPEDPTSDIGPLISDEHRERVHGFVQRASAAGAKVLTGGDIPDLPGYFYPPTLITNVKQNDEIVQNEVFGPVLVVLPFDDEAQAIELANDSQFGLASSVWTADVARALRVAHQIEAGVTWINDHLPIASEAPHGGVKNSGFGKDMSHEALLEYTVTRHVMLKHAVTEVKDSFRPS